MAKAANKPDNGMTPKQEAFALAFFETGNAAEAYRRAYGVTTEDRDSWVYVEACQLLDHPKITLRLKSLQEQAERHSIYTRNKALEEYEDARAMAMTEKNPSAAIAAVTGKVKLSGMDKPSRVEVTGKDGGAIETKDTTSPTETARRIAFMLASAVQEQPE